MSSRYIPFIPEYAQRAFEQWYLSTINDETCEAFVGKWGGFSSEHFLRALRQGAGEDRLCAMFALGASPSPEDAEVLLPFLHSERREERCVSTITLGRWRDESVLEALLELLQEGLMYILSPEARPEEKERNVPWHSQDAEQAYQLRYDWCMIQRRYLVVELASWQHPLVIPASIWVFEVCYNLEMQSPFPEIHFSFFLDLQTLQDCLAYALGQQEAWDASDRLRLPAERLHILRMFMVYGAIYAKASRVVGSMWYLRYKEIIQTRDASIRREALRL